MIWLIGAGGMSIDYAKVLQAQKKEFTVIGRGNVSAKLFEEKTKHTVVSGGIEKFLSTAPVTPESVILSVGVEQLYDTTMQLLKYGVKHLLVEKPGGLSYEEIQQLSNCADENGAQIFIAYNRRFYSSVLKVRELVEQDGGVTSFNFELTEWSHIIGALDKNTEVLAKWFLANSTHVADLAFFLGGKPEQITCYTAGNLDWHSSSSIFAGAGISENGALFNYGADWESAGRWSVEILTNKNRFILRPMEVLQVQKRGSIKLDYVEIEDLLDNQFKPGLFLQVQAFLERNFEALCSINEQLILFPVYEEMAKYD
jgi:predicted dehydrogenase